MTDEVDTPTDEQDAQAPAEGETSDAKAEDETAAKTSADDSDADPSEDDQDEGSEGDDEPDEKPKRRSGYQRLKAQKERLERELQELRQRGPVSTKEPTEDDIVREIGEAPKEADYPDYLAYERALTAYESEKRIVRRELKKAADTAAYAEKQRINDLMDDFAERASEFAEKHPDYQEAVQAAAPIQHQGVLESLMESEIGPDIAYHLAKNPAKVRELNSMSANRALIELGRIEARLSSPKPKTSTKAPKPVGALKGGASAKPDPSKMSMEEYVRWRKENSG